MLPAVLRRDIEHFFALSGDQARALWTSPAPPAGPVPIPYPNLGAAGAPGAAAENKSYVLTSVQHAGHDNLNAPRLIDGLRVLVRSVETLSATGAGAWREWSSLKAALTERPALRHAVGHELTHIVQQRR